MLEALHSHDEGSPQPLRPQLAEETAVRLVLASLLTYEEGECDSPPARTRARGDPTFADVLAQAVPAAPGGGGGALGRRKQLAKLVHAALQDVLPEQKMPSAAVVAGLLSRDQVNEFGFWTAGGRERFAAAFAPAAALLNHSCAPALVKLTRPGFVTEFRALRTLVPGDELTYSYLPLSAGVTDRQDVLEGVFHFTCDCERCSAAEEGQVESTPLEAHTCAGGGVIYPIFPSPGRGPPLRCSSCGETFVQYPGLVQPAMGCCGGAKPSPKPKPAAATPSKAAALAPAPAQSVAMFDLGDEEDDEDESHDDTTPPRRGLGTAAVQPQ
jgi:hypothetical protein